MDQRERVIQAVLQLLDELPDLLGAEAEGVEDRLRTYVHQAVVDPGPESLRELVKAVRAQPGLVQRFNDLVGGSWRGVESLAPGSASFVPIEVMYATDRAPTGDQDPTRWFGGDRHVAGEAVSLGRCVVTIPSKHEKGQLESPGLFTRGDPSRHVLLASLEPLSTASFDDHVKGQFSAEPRGLLFVHGYNVSFADAVRRAAQVAYDMKFTEVGPTFCFSWPSKAEFLSYGADADSAKWAAQHLASFLNHLRAATPALRLHVVAHSMGNRVVTDALERLHLAREAPVENLSDVALAAPDVDRNVFESLAGSLRESARRVTLYASSRDRALWLSKMLHQGERAGDTGERMLTLEGIDSIDATLADSSLLSLGHSYFAGRPTVLRDLGRLFLEGLGPAERGLKRHSSSSYWLM